MATLPFCSIRQLHLPRVTRSVCCLKGQIGALAATSLLLVYWSCTASAKVIAPQITSQNGLTEQPQTQPAVAVPTDWIAQGSFKTLRPVISASPSIVPGASPATSYGVRNDVAGALQALPTIERDAQGVWQAAPTDKVSNAKTDMLVLKRQILRAAAIHSLDPYLVKAVAWAESRFQANAVSPKNAVGLMQVLPSTARFLGLRQVDNTPVSQLLKDPWVSLLVGTRYLSQQLTAFGGRADLALAAYNAGPGAVERAGMRIPNYPETQKYVRTVLAYCEAQRKAKTLEGVV